MSQLLSGVGGTILSIMLALLIILIMVTVHEFGHYLAGKALKFKIEEFAIGFGPALFKHKKKNGEVFSVRLLPLGGYCAFAGESTAEEEEGLNTALGEGLSRSEKEQENPDAFNAKAPWMRIIVLLAGVVMNYLLSIILIIISLFAFGQSEFIINSVEPDSKYPAQYSLENGDILLSLNGEGIYVAPDLSAALGKKKAGDKISAEVIRGGERKNIEIILRADCDFLSTTDGVSLVWKALGVGGVPRGEDLVYDINVVNCHWGFWETLGRSFVYSGKVAGTIFRVLGELLTGRLSLTAMGGPVTTIKLTSEIVSQSFQGFFEIAAFIGVNFAIFNLLPIPALDGSKVVFCIIEWIFKKPVPRNIEAIIHAVGFILILGFSVLVDVLHFI